MPLDKSNPTDRWVIEFETFGKKLQALAKAAASAEGDAFAIRELLERVDKTLSDTNLNTLKAPQDLRKSIETACIEATAEFWQRFCAAAKELGWETHGSTERRLIARSCFVELKNDIVTIEGAPGKHTPQVSAVVELLKPVLAGVAIDKKGLQEFVEVLAQAYDNLNAQGEVPIEAVFRQCVLLIQPATFWANIEASKFQALSRPLFRCRLSAILVDNIRPADGRDLRLTPTVNRKDVWELFSPAEGRVVQVGRIAFVKR